MLDMKRVTGLFNIQYPIIQAGMVWVSGWRLASAVSNAGGLGLIGAGSMHPDNFRAHILLCKAATSKPFGVNIPLMYPQVDTLIQIVIEEGVKIVFTSAGNPRTWTGKLKEQGITVVHVVSSALFAEKAAAAGCDAVVAEGFEAGGHNGREETTSFVLIPLIKSAVGIPVIAAGGIATGKQILAAMVLGAEGVQIGSRFVASDEASAHMHFKQAVVHAKEGDTKLMMKQLVPVRLLKNAFFNMIDDAEKRGASAEEIAQILGKGRAKRGMFEGNMLDGELEIGQVSALINDILPACVIVNQLWEEFKASVNETLSLSIGS
jgi:enoyl-[acyl-carrier protein] reductase II